MRFFWLFLLATFPYLAISSTPNKDEFPDKWNDGLERHYKHETNQISGEWMQREDKTFHNNSENEEAQHRNMNKAFKRFNNKRILEDQKINEASPPNNTNNEALNDTQPNQSITSNNVDNLIFKPVHPKILLQAMKLVKISRDHGFIDSTANSLKKYHRRIRDMENIPSRPYSNEDCEKIKKSFRESYTKFIDELKQVTKERQDEALICIDQAKKTKHLKLNKEKAKECLGIYLEGMKSFITGRMKEREKRHGTTRQGLNEILKKTTEALEGKGSIINLDGQQFLRSGLESYNERITKALELWQTIYYLEKVNLNIFLMKAQSTYGLCALDRQNGPFFCIENFVKSDPEGIWGFANQRDVFMKSIDEFSKTTIKDKPQN